MMFNMMKYYYLLIKEKEKGKLEKINSKYILKIVLDNLEKKKLLYIIKFNKNIKKRIGININQYKKYSQKNTPIEIEIKPVKNKYDKFINISDEDKLYYHIYFNNNKEEIKRKYINENEDIKIIKIIIDYQVKSFKELFLNSKCIESINFKKFNRNNITDMSYMFSECSSLKELNLNNFNTNNVTNMSYMFFGCSSLIELNLNNFKNNKVKDMSYMFSGCSSLKELNIKNFYTNNVTNMLYMFSGCSSLIELKLDNFDTSKVIDMRYMFYDCSSLKALKINNFNIDNVILMSGVFYGCSKELIMKIKTQYKDLKGRIY